MKTSIEEVIIASIIYQPGFGPELNALLSGLSMLQDFTTSRNYRNKVNELLSGRHEGRETITEEAPYTMELPTGFEPEFVPEGYGYKGQMKPVGKRQVQTTVPIERQRTPEELMAYDIQTRRMADAAAAGVPPQYRIDTRSLTMQPELSYEDKWKVRDKYRSPKSAQMFKDLKGNYYDANTPQGKAGIIAAGKKGWNPQRVSSENQFDAFEKMYGMDRFLREEDYVKFLEEQRLKATTTPEERKNLALEPRMKQLDKVFKRAVIGEPNQKHFRILERAKQKMRAYKAKDWSKLTSQDNKYFGKILNETWAELYKANKKPKKKDVLEPYGL